MIKISPFEKSYENGIVISGHAGSAPQGFDIVCAGVSAIAHSMFKVTCAFGIEALERKEDGYLHLNILEPSEESNKIVEGFLTSLADLERQYPEYIEIVEGDF